MKPDLPVIPAAIRSHVLPSLYVADGYRAVPHSGMLVGYQMQASFIIAQKQKPTYWRQLKRYYLFITTFLFFNNIVAQDQLSTIYSNLVANQGIILNPAIKIKSNVEYLSFLTKMFESDQRYRIILNSTDMKRDSASYWKLIRMMKNNDKVNQIILLKLLKKFGWPCSKDDNYSFSAWIVVWHADMIDRNSFYPYLKWGLQKGCILKEHYKQFKIE